MRLYILSAFTLLCTALAAQKPQTILGIAKENKTIEYYSTQASLWEKEIAKRPDNGTAWLNLYKAHRAKLQLQKPQVWKNDKPTLLAELKYLGARCKLAMGESFDYYFIEGMNALGKEATRLFEKAYAVDPDRPEVHGWLFAQYVPAFKEENNIELGRKMLANNIYSNANLMWNYNALQSAAPNSLFITNADMDCEPKWVLQYGAGVRRDVLVVSRWILASNPTYRSQILSKINALPPSKEHKDFDSPTDYMDYLIAHVIRNSKRPVFMSSGTDINFLRKHNLQDDMYIIGAAIQYSATSFDNVSVTRKNFEEKYKMEYLLQNFQQHAEDKVIKEQMNLTYLPALFSLREYYSINDIPEQLNYTNRLIDQIAEDSGRKEAVLSWFN